MRVGISAVERQSEFFDFLIGTTRYRAWNVRRLNLRHRFLVRRFEEEIRGSRILDLAAHDGRWAYAYAAAGAESVIGYEARQNLVDEFQQYPDSVFKRKVRLVVIDIFDGLDALTKSGQTFDIVTVLGVFYHIMDHYRLLRLIHRLQPRLVILDSEFMIPARPYIRLALEDPSRDMNTFSSDASGRAPVGIPSQMALEMMAKSLDYRVDWLDWETVAKAERAGIGDYFRRGPKRRFTCTLRASP